ncbi:hypothetical protein [Actinophytocola sp.]|uniref:hypothetical protein n=1 Tax=Actinophytocola sp. TaxID=1872138 RepID=UPI002D7E6B74|nr:hypothetical protein [Actinophytocola sp.]HET9141842.1 hypothetical protein [Actinophytocola sp.]
MSTEYAQDRSWIFGLVAPDAPTRGEASVRHRSLVAAARDAGHRIGHLWVKTQAGAPPRLAAALDQAHADYSWHRRQTIFGLLDDGLAADQLVRELHAPFTVLYLAWEARDPQDWGASHLTLESPWTLKEAALRVLARDGVSDGLRPRVTELLLAALYRPYRCKDWMYPKLVRHLDGDVLADRVAALLDVADPWVRLRARFVLHLVEHPELAVTRTAWRRWLLADVRV